jgi:hypothetical protein
MGQLNFLNGAAEALPGVKMRLLLCLAGRENKSEVVARAPIMCNKLCREGIAVTCNATTSQTVSDVLSIYTRYVPSRYPSHWILDKLSRMRTT